MARNIFYNISDIDSLSNKKIITREELSLLESTDEIIKKLEAEAISTLDTAKMRAKTIIDSAVSESNRLIEKSESNALRKQKLHEMSIEEKQRSYWIKTVQSLSEEIENISRDIISKIINNYDETEVISSLINKSLEKFKNCQSLTIRVPKENLNAIEIKFPNLKIIGEASMKNKIEIEIEDEIYIVEIDDIT